MLVANAYQVRRSARNMRRVGELNQASNGEIARLDDHSSEADTWSLAKSVVIATSLALSIAAVIVVVTLWRLGITSHLSSSVSTVLDVVKLAFALVAGIGGTVGLVLAYRRHKLAEAAAAIDRAKEDREARKELRENAKELRDIERSYNERFGAAAAQIGSDQAAVRLAGIYAMAGVADDWDSGRQQCIDVLCAIVRRRSSSGEGGELPAQESLARYDDREIRRTTIRVIKSRLQSDAIPSWSQNDFDFTGAEFEDIDFSGANFTGGTVSFNGAVFRDGYNNLSQIVVAGSSIAFDDARFASGLVSFEQADFGGGRIGFDRCDFEGAEVLFDESTFNGAYASFHTARFAGGEVSFDRVSFNDGKVFFGLAEFRSGEVHLGGRFYGGDVDFDGARFMGAKVAFDNPIFSSGKISFDRTSFVDGELSFPGAWFEGTEITLADAKFEGGKVDFSNSKSWAVPPRLALDRSDSPAGLILPAETEV